MHKTTDNTRDWMCTISLAHHDNPSDIKQLYEDLGAVGVYQLEQGGKTDYQHWQCFIQFANPIRFATLKNRLQDMGFADVHLEPRRSTVANCVAYCTKIDTRLADPVFVGDINMRDRQGARTDLSSLRLKILQDNKTAHEIMLADSGGKTVRYYKYLQELELAKTEVVYSSKMRDITVNYLYGNPGTGKTSYIYNLYPMQDIYRVTDYDHPFDSYNAQPVLVFDEFSSQIPWEQLLVLLDKFPTQLPARFHNRWAAYTTVWLISNLSLSEQYKFVQGDRRKALTRRISHMYHAQSLGKIVDTATTLTPAEQSKVNEVAQMFSVQDQQTVPNIEMAQALL